MFVNVGFKKLQKLMREWIVTPKVKLRTVFNALILMSHNNSVLGVRDYNTWQRRAILSLVQFGALPLSAMQ